MLDRSMIHPVKIPFKIPVSPELSVDRFVYSYIIADDQIHIIDTGVSGTEKLIYSYMEKLGAKPSDLKTVVLTHSHPDHIGAAFEIRRRSNVKIYAHGAERGWIEDVELQKKQRPVPGFDTLVAGSVDIDTLVDDGSFISFGKNTGLFVMHTPGHSPGSISLHSENNSVLFCGDAIPQTGDLPIYDDVLELAQSLIRISRFENLSFLYSSWADPLSGDSAVQAIQNGISHLKKIHSVVLESVSEIGDSDPMKLCKMCVERLGLPPFAANPIVARSFVAHLAEPVRNDLESLLG
jgi:glyoxylase-like metal-dependent hydrolase (beta-lactamase superfamily II)